VDRDPGRGRGRRTEPAGHERRRRQQGRQLLGPDAGDRQGLGVPVEAVQVEQSGPGGDRVVGQEHPAQLLDDEVLDPHPVRGPGAQVRAVLGEPRQLRQRGHRVHRRARPPVERHRARGRPDAVRLGGGPGVRPGQRRRDRAAGGVQAEQGVHGRAERQGEHRAGRLRGDLADGPEHRRDDHLRVLLGVPGDGLVEGVGDRMDRRRPAREVVRHRLRRGRADVHPDHEARRHRGRRGHGCTGRHRLRVGRAAHGGDGAHRGQWIVT